MFLSCTLFFFFIIIIKEVFVGERSLSLSLLREGQKKKRLSNTGAWAKCFSIISPMRCHADSRLEQNGCCACVLREKEWEARWWRRGGRERGRDKGSKASLWCWHSVSPPPPSKAERWNKNGQKSSIIRRNGRGWQRGRTSELSGSYSRGKGK